MKMEDLITGKNNNAKTDKDKQEPKKKYKRCYLHTETIDLLYDLIYTEKDAGNFDYTIGDAIKEGLEAITKKRKLKKAPEAFKKSRGVK